ncbi:hypothetical protein BH24PSE2_BH24PSE2_17910 [soil metagenome]
MIVPKACIVAIGIASGVLSGCDDPPPPRSVEFLMREAPALQATLLRCRDPGFDPENDPECANARRAVERVAAREAEAARTRREAENELNREALRRLRDLEGGRAAARPEQEAEASRAAVGAAESLTTLSDEALEAEIRRLQGELDRRREANSAAPPD